MDETEIIRKAQELIQRWDNLRIVGSRGEWSGNARQRFMFNPQRGGGSAGGGTTPTVTGACCIDGDCSITTEVLCVAAGGTYQGDDTTCDPNPCPVPGTGACCVGSDCSIQTEEDCNGMGGTYQGDGTTCSPNPCMVECSCGFDDFDGSGRRFLTRTWTVNGYYHWEDSDAVCGDTFCTLTINFTKTSTYDPNTCVLTEECTGSYTWDAELYPPQSIHENGDWCIDQSAGCGSCAGDCSLPIPSGSVPSCSDPGCSCSATEIDCFHSDSTSNLCNCAAGRPGTVTGNCSLTQSVVLSDECIPV